MDTPKETYRVTYSGKKWIVELDGCAHPVGSFRSKRDALKHILRVANDVSAKVHVVDDRKSKVPVKTATYIAILEKDEASDYSVWFPDFPGCITAGSTLEEVQDMAAEALAFMIEGMLEDGESIPHPSTLEAVMEDPFASLGLPFLVTVPAPPAKSNQTNVTLPAKRLQVLSERTKEIDGSPFSVTKPDQKAPANPLSEVETIALPAEGFARLRTVLQVIPVSQSTWYEGVAEGHFPKPQHIPGTSTTLYDVADIRAFMERIRENA